MKEKEILLIVDDMNVACNTLAEILRLDGYIVKTAISGQEALKIVKDEAIDCVLTDIKMPNMNGVELLHEIKNIKPNVPVMLMTAYSTNKLVEEGMAAGALRTLFKPLDINKLRMEIVKALTNN